MSINFRIVYVLCMSLFLVNCTVSTRIDSPTSPPSSPSNDLKKTLDFKACNKKESDLAISDDAKKNAMTITDKIESQEVETTDCEGNVNSSRRPVRDLNQIIQINAPQDFSGKVTFMTVENARTCSIQGFDSTDKLDSNEIKIDGEEPIQIVSEGDRAGNARIIVNDMDVKINAFINVLDGSNVLKISYYGKCLQYRENPDASIKSQYYLCKQAELLGTKEVLLNVQVDRPEIVGTKKVSICSK